MRFSMQGGDKDLARTVATPGRDPRVLAAALHGGLGACQAAGLLFRVRAYLRLSRLRACAGLLAAGTLLLRGRAWGQVLPLPCAGLISLGLVGVGFNLANGVYTSSLADGCLMAGAINLWCVALGLALTVAVGPSMQTVRNIRPT